MKTFTYKEILEAYAKAMGGFESDLWNSEASEACARLILELLNNEVDTAFDIEQDAMTLARISEY